MEFFIPEKLDDSDDSSRIASLVTGGICFRDRFSTYVSNGMKLSVEKLASGNDVECSRSSTGFGIDGGTLVTALFKVEKQGKQVYVTSGGRKASVDSSSRFRPNINQSGHIKSEGGGQLIVDASRSTGSAASHVNPVLFCLRDEGVKMYSLPEIHLKSQAERTAGAICFSYHEKSQCLAVILRKKRLLLFQREGINLVLLEEVTLQYQGTSCVLLNDNCVCVASKRAVTFFKISSGAGRRDVLHHRTIDFPEDVVLSAMKKGHRVLVTHGRVSCMYDRHGRKVQPAIQFLWKNDPDFILNHGPFYVSFNQRVQELEVQLDTSVEGEDCNQKPSQNIRLSSMTIAPVIDVVIQVPDKKMPKSLVLLLSDENGRPNMNQVQYLVQANAHAIVEHLVEMNLFETALSIIRNDGSLKSLESAVRLRYGKHLLHEGRVEEGLLNFSMSNSSDPIEVLQFFDFLLPPTLLEKLRFNGDSTISETSLQESEELILPYLLSFRSRVMTPSFGVTESKPDDLSWTIVDTAVFNCLMRLPDTGSLLQFLQKENRVDYESSRMSLHKQGRYSELIYLHKNYGNHPTALDLLKKLTLHPEYLDPPPVGASVELKGLTGVWATVKYLISMKHVDPSLLQFHSRWIMDLDPDAAVDMFIKLYPMIEPSTAMPILSQAGLKYPAAGQYLEQIRDCLAGNMPVYDQLLAETYIKFLLETKSNDHQILGRFKDLILRSSVVDAGELVSLLPGQGAPFVRAILYERLKRHKEALSIYVKDIQQMKDVEEFCFRVRREASGKWGESIYITLLKIVFLENVDSKTDLKHLHQPTIEILSKHMDASFALDAVRLLPDEISIEKSSQLLCSTIWSVDRKKRRGDLTKSLAQSKLLQLTSRKAEIEKSPIIITSDRTCAVCRKRIGVSACIVCDRVLRHVSCHSRMKS